MTGNSSHSFEQQGTLNGIGYESVETTASLLVTRFQLRSPVALVRFYLLYRRIRREAETCDGLIKQAFLIENSRTCYTISLWRDNDAIKDFNARIRSHIDAANFCFRDLVWSAGKPLLWSAQFGLSAISPSNLRWRGAEVRDLIRTESQHHEGALACSSK